MKRFLKRIAVSLLLLPLTWVIGVVVMGETMKNQTPGNVIYPEFGLVEAKMQDLDTSEQVEVFALGSSHCYRSLDPRVFKENGIPMFNFGSSSQSPIQTEILAHKFIPQIGASTVLIEVGPMSFLNEGLEGMLRVIPAMEPSSDLFEAVLRINKVKSYNSFLFHLYRTYVRDVPVPAKRRVMKNYVPGGFVPHLDTLDGPVKVRPFDAEEPIQANVDAFVRTVTWLQEKGVRVVLFEAPVTPEFHEQGNSLRNGFIAELVEELGVEHYSFAQMESLDPEHHFHDANHLNLAGARIFSQELLSTIPME